MRKVTAEELKEILEKHRHWWNEDCDGWEDMCADLQGAYLQGADLQGADLRGADLQGADLRGADLQGAYLRCADLQGAYLRCADLQGADLQGAYLWCADLRDADLRGADLRGADLQGADLQGADLQGAHNIPFIPKTCPDTGAFIGWKKARLQGGASAIVKLRISEDAKRTSGTGRKCRCDKAEVLEIWSVDAKTRELKAKYQEAYSSRDISFTYRVGETVTPTKPFDECRWNEYSSGIHFFINLQEAIEY